MMQRYADTLFDRIDRSTVEFTLTTFQTAETLPKRHACEFWTKTIGLGTNRGSEEVKQKIKKITAAFGPQLAHSLVRQIGGAAMRGDIDSLCDPFRAVLTSVEGGQKLLEQSLTADTFPAAHVDVETRRLFLRQVLTARNDRRKIKELMTALWAQCRGTVLSYSS
jgi:hypothetical protein